VQKEKWSSKESREWTVVYPFQHKVAAEGIPEPIRSEFEEASLCFVIKAYKACALMCQITLEHVWQDKHVSGLAQLRDDDIISTSLYNRANQVRLWGNLVKHELLTDPVSPEDAEQLLGYLEILLNEIYAEPERLDKLAKKLKKLEKKD
jgi:hypothetical protein